MLQAAIVFVSTIMLVACLRPIARTIGLVDRPGGRKRHHGEVPVVGGLAMFGGYAIGAMMLPASTLALLPAFLSVAMLVAVGAIDDCVDLRPWVRLLVQVAAAIVMMQSAGVAIDRVLTWSDGAFIGLGALAMPFTVLAVIAAINSYNIVDGIDGLAGGLGLIALLSFLLLDFIRTGQIDTALVVACAPVAAFLVFNAPLAFNRRMRCFMGDAGSTMIGFLVAWFGIRISQDAQANVQPTTILWMTALPLMELLVSFGRRLAKGRSPFLADADHFHHQLMRAGLSAPAASGALLSIAAAYAVCGLLMEHFAVAGSVSLLLLLTTGTVCCMALGNISTCRKRLARLRSARFPLRAVPLSFADTAVTPRATAAEETGLDRAH
ncbi:MAG: undecaprenyl/decaprenyl-phosphate alpha-N-acetylglucosaminyl 1-phosphate transferase [Steroidobacteraceae bacterium]|nr:undecaprenyl/decaprenyl-phosphate alpha-N-acetylglucosaminyl 1-phosphate transferase [Steroidobacteraceae bacterium]